MESILKNLNTGPLNGFSIGTMHAKLVSIENENEINECINDINKAQNAGPAFCIKCNYKNEYIEYNKNYVCYKCKNF